MPRFWIAIAAVLQALAIGAGAVGAHLQAQYSSLTTAIHIYETGQRYHALYALALFGLGALMLIVEDRQTKWSFYTMNGAAALLTLGILCFSGGIYIGIAQGMTSNSAVVPFGGGCLIVSWVLIAVSVLGLRRQS